MYKQSIDKLSTELRVNGIIIKEYMSFKKWHDMKGKKGLRTYVHSVAPDQSAYPGSLVLDLQIPLIGQWDFIL